MRSLYGLVCLQAGLIAADRLNHVRAIVRATSVFGKEMSKKVRRASLCGARLSRSAIDRIAEAAEADQHQRPG